MRNRITIARSLALGLLVLWCWLSAVSAERPAQVSSTPPRLFFSDLESGPNSGGQDNLGLFLMLWGEGFGAIRGNSRVTIGGQEVVRYVVWGEDNALARGMDMIVVQVGNTITTGNIVVTVNAQLSNPLTFTVRSGNIYFVMPSAPNANDSNPGTFAQPWRTIYRPRAIMQAGDIVYIKGGTFSTLDPERPGWDAILTLDEELAANGTADRPIAYLGYPGDSPILGNLAARRGILLFTSGAPRDYYVLANLRLSLSSAPVGLVGRGHRLVGNDFYDGAHDPSGVIGVGGDAAQLKIFGNLLRNNGDVDNKFRHGLYLQGFGSNRDIEFGWNHIQDQRGGRAIQLFGHADGDFMDNVRIHDNLLMSSELNNVTIGGTDGSTEVIGTVYFYNNIVVGGGEPGVRVNDPQGTVYIQNSTFYSNTTSQVYLQRAGAGRVTLQNNIVDAGAGPVYYTFEPGGATSASFSASRNLVYNAGACPAWDTGCINADPKFVNIASRDFRLQPQSPAIDAGINTGLNRDYAGIIRPQGLAYDIGAHEFVTASVGLSAKLYLPLVIR